MNKNNEHKYDDIINLPHHTSKKRPPMAKADRAAQFAPFAALTGYDSAVKETARLTDRRIELDEYEKAELNDKIRLIREHTDKSPYIIITYFRPDERKDGGEYRSVAGGIKKIDDYKRYIIMENGLNIPIDNIFGIDGNIFDEVDETQGY